MADDITVEADSGGHTDNRPLVCLLPSMIALRDELQATYGYATPVRIAAGGISTAKSILGAFMMGAAYVVTGSINHASVEAGTSPQVKQLLAQAAATDVMASRRRHVRDGHAGAGAQTRHALPMRARSFYEFLCSLRQHRSAAGGRARAVGDARLQRSLDAVGRLHHILQHARSRTACRAAGDPKRKMALIFRWYLGLATRWGIQVSATADGLSDLVRTGDGRFQ